MTGRPDQLRISSAMYVSRHESLVDSRLAERCERLMTVLTPVSGGLGEVHGRVDQSGLHGPNQISRVHPFHGVANGIDLQKIADDHFSAERFERRRPVVFTMHHRTHAETERDRLANRGATRIARGACNQDFL